MRKYGLMIKAAVVSLLVALLAGLSCPLTVNAEESKQKVVRVGCHEAPYFIKDKNGRLSGYSYEYQRKVAAYTGWKYEYVEGTFSDLMEMLKKGEIDLMSDVSYMEERAKDILYASLPMGTEAYYLFVSSKNQEITSKNLSSLNGKKVGIVEGSVTKKLFLEWEKFNGISAEIVELNCSDEDTLKQLDRTIDACITMDFYGSAESYIPISKIGSSEIFFAVAKNRTDLKQELDMALSRIQDENKYYDQQLHDKYLKATETNKYLTNSERDWLSAHGAIRVGYQDNYLAFCAKDTTTGKLTGALKDYLDYASSAFENAHLTFEAFAYPTASDAMEALEQGKIDCVFPANLTDFDSEQLNIVMTPALMRSEMDAVVRLSDQKEFLRKKKVVVAVNEGNTNYDLFLAEHYPKWDRAYFKDTPTGLEAVASGNADCVIISNYRFSNISKQCETLKLTTVYTGVEMDYCFAVRAEDTTLYSIISRITGVVPDSVVHSALTYYSAEEVKVSLGEIIKDNLFVILAVIASILLVIVILLLHNIRADKKILEKEHQVENLNRLAYVDSLTSVRNKGAYSDYIDALQERLDKDELFDLAIGIFDCNDLKSINDKYGHDKGDLYLKAACQLICKVFDHSPVFRIGGDEFAVFLMNSDFNKREELVETLIRRQNERNASVENKWEETHLAYGMAVFDHDHETELTDTIRRADKAMYDNKNKMKKASNG
ncbi:MAG: transporter substrate-binding domain-containing protein [Ruminococcaceae bacterium]|nr:transporter substrate-binding domain-containing protein [Oscillospiraceae bacterium]